ncbi:MAG: tRNA-dihydrouridine synthase family protein [Kiritimatiellaeota bacterium]|nr:tRNA-dihydrouridine synthase family protein [Kiritimatiellota bacterium]
MSNPLHTIFGLRDNGLPLVFLAPMAGYSNAPMRRISHRHGAAMSYTEMANARALLNPSERTWALMETTKLEGPVVAHLYGTEPDVFAEAAVKVEQTKRFVAIDLNAGCPAKKVLAEGAGAELIKDPQRIHDMIVAARRVVSLPITLKTRLGPSPDKLAIYDVLAAVEAAGGAALALHARYTSQGHRGDVHYNLLAQVKQRANIPIIGNGNVHTPYAAWHMFEKTRVDAIMLGRAAVGNPWIFTNIRDSFKTRIKPKYHPPTHSRPKMNLETLGKVLFDHLDLEREHLKVLSAKYGIPPTAEDIEETVVNAFRCRHFRYLHSLKGACYVRKCLSELRTVDAVREAVQGCFDREAAYRATLPPKPVKPVKKKIPKKKA